MASTRKNLQQRHRRRLLAKRRALALRSRMFYERFLRPSRVYFSKFYSAEIW